MTGINHPNLPNVTIPGVNALYLNHDDQNYPLFEIFHQMESEQIFPEYIWGHHGAYRIPNPLPEDGFFLLSMELFKKYYNEVDTMHGKNHVMHGAHRNPQVYFLRLKEEYRDRMIRAGYSYDPTGFNKASMGSLVDLHRAFAGFVSPLKEQVDERMEQ